MRLSGKSVEPRRLGSTYSGQDLVCAVEGERLCLAAGYQGAGLVIWRVASQYRGRPVKFNHIGIPTAG